MSTEKKTVSCQEHARLYTRKGLCIAPLWHSTIEGCGCGDALCELPGRHPIGSIVADATSVEDAAASLFKGYPTSNLAIVTGSASGILAVDINPYSEIVSQSLDKLLQEYGVNSETSEIRSSRTRALLYRIPSGYPVIPEMTRVPEMPNVNILGEAGFVVAPPSIDSFIGECYRWVRISPTLEMCTPLLDLVLGVKTESCISLLKTKIQPQTAVRYLQEFYSHLVTSGVDPKTAEELTRRKAQGFNPLPPRKDIDPLFEGTDGQGENGGVA